MRECAKVLSMQDVRLHSIAVDRNRDPILEVLRRHMAPRGTVLEVASGTGGHVVYFAHALPDTEFQPSDPNPSARASIDAWVADAALPNVRPALDLDAEADNWPIDRADAVLCINMVHISPWAATLGLMAGAARVLAPGGLLYLYGPYRVGGTHTAPSNVEFDRSLRERDPEWGVRDLEAVQSVAIAASFAAATVEPMPANNLSLIFRRV
jgi:SAM-dependent methyltransferase